jgi:hypothetical protein
MTSSRGAQSNDEVQIGGVVARVAVVGQVVRVAGSALPNDEIDFLPRRERKWSWRAAILAWLILALVIAAEFTLTGRGWVNTIELADHGVRVAATVVKLEPGNHGGCQYTYSVDSHSYTKSDERCGETRQVGDRILITYVPSHPAVSTADSPGGNLRNALLINTGVPTLFAIVIGRRGAIRRRRIVAASRTRSA